MFTGGTGSGAACAIGAAWAGAVAVAVSEAAGAEAGVATVVTGIRCASCDNIWLGLSGRGTTSGAAGVTVVVGEPGLPTGLATAGNAGASTVRGGGTVAGGGTVCTV